MLIFDFSFRVLSLIRFLGPFMPVPSMAPAASMPCRPWHGTGAFPSFTSYRYILSRNVSSDSAGGKAFTCRQRLRAGGSSWRRVVALPISRAYPKPGIVPPRRPNGSQHTITRPRTTYPCKHASPSSRSCRKKGAQERGTSQYCSAREVRHLD